MNSNENRYCVIHTIHQLVYSIVTQSCMFVPATGNLNSTKRAGFSNILAKLPTKKHFNLHRLRVTCLEKSHCLILIA
jgi:hypothetical protein